MNALHCPRMSVFSFKYTEATCLVSCLHAFTTPEPGHQQVLTDIVELQSDEDIRHLIAPIPHSAEHPKQKPFVLASHGWQPPPPSSALRDPSCQLTSLYCCCLLPATSSSLLQLTNSTQVPCDLQFSSTWEHANNNRWLFKTKVASLIEEGRNLVKSQG